MTSSRVILPAVSGRLKEYELSAILMRAPGIRLSSPTARAVFDATDRAEAAMVIDRVRNRRRCRLLCMVGSSDWQYIPTSVADTAPSLASEATNRDTHHGMRFPGHTQWPDRFQVCRGQEL